MMISQIVSVLCFTSAIALAVLAVVAHRLRNGTSAGPTVVPPSFLEGVKREHAVLVQLGASIEEVADLVIKGEHTFVEPLRRLSLALIDRLTLHIAFEDVEMGPLFEAMPARERDEWTQEHASQETAIAKLRELLGAATSTRGRDVARLSLGLVAALRLDMEREEKALEAARATSRTISKDAPTLRLSLADAMTLAG
jgi:hypothetical protein